MLSEEIEQLVPANTCSFSSRAHNKINTRASVTVKYDMTKKLNVLDLFDLDMMYTMIYTLHCSKRDSNCPLHSDWPVTTFHVIFTLQIIFSQKIIIDDIQPIILLTNVI